MADSIEKLLIARRVVKGQLTRFQNFLNQNTNSTQIKARLESCKLLLDKFNEIQSSIEILNEKELDSDERQTFEDIYYETVSMAESMINETSNKGSIATPNTNKISTMPLPSFKVPYFDGTFEKFGSFRDAFTSCVINNSEYSNVHKFYVLLSHLKGPALRAIEFLEVSNENFPIAWETLQTRFENKKLTIKNHIKTICELPNVSKDSYLSLQNFLDDFNHNFVSLERLGEPVKQWNAILIYILASKLDTNSQKEWEIQTKDIHSPSIDQFLLFLSDRCKLLNSLGNLNDSKLSNFPKSKPTQIQNFNSKSHVHLLTEKTNCIVCDGKHLIYYCQNFLELSISGRISKIKALNACLNCLRNDHATNQCSRSHCKHCNKKHNSLLHIQPEKADSNKKSSYAETKPSSIESQANVTNLTAQSSNYLQNTYNILGTALIYIKNNNNDLILCRALLDNGAQSNFITSDLSHKLGLSTEPINHNIVGINGISIPISQSLKAEIQSTVYKKYKFNLKFLILNQIVDPIPSVTFNISNINIPKHIKLADPNFNKSSNIDMLLSVNIFYDILFKQQYKLNKIGPILQNSKLGWIVSGPYLANQQRNTKCMLTRDEQLDQELERFWLIDQIPTESKILSNEEKKCELHFQNHTIKKNGKFVVSLPFRENPDKLIDNRLTAIKNFKKLEIQLNKNPNIKELYSKFMSDYVNLGHMSLINDNEINSKAFYLPHHAVIKETSLTSKLRVVFNASSKSSNNISLNDVLMLGPHIQDNIFDILLRFRSHSIVFTADIEKMYRCIEVDEKDRDYQRIVWRFDNTMPLKHYRLNTVTYGTAPASFLATRCLQQLAIENQTEFPDASNSIRSNFYMDDWLDGGDDLHSILSLAKSVDDILSKANFHLRQWLSNDPSFLKHFPHNNSTETNYLFKDTNCTSKILGISWNPTKDTFQYSTMLDKANTITKRTVLSLISKIYDPLGLIAPLVINSKVFLQKLWTLKLGWDEELPPNLIDQWSRYLNKLSLLNSIYIDRKILIKSPCCIQLHIFSDASESAYGASVYVRSVDNEGKIFVNLLCAKSKVAPLKRLSLPRLELCGALVAAKLFNLIKPALTFKINDIIFWSDSTIVLSWLSNEPSKFKTFVANRVSKIQSLTEHAQWRHIYSKDNPADLISRGCYGDDEIKLNMWFKGPQWLSKNCNSWPTPIFTFTSDSTEERKTIDTILLTINDLNIITRFSSYNRLLRVVAYIFRFIKNTTTKINNKKNNLKITCANENLNLSELDKSKNAIIKNCPKGVVSRRTRFIN